MSTLYLMYGLPGSGKSSFAKQMEGVYRLNRDQLREMMFPGKKYSSSREKAVVEVEQAVAQALLTSNRSVVIDDTNIHRVTRERWYTLAKEVNPKIKVVILKMNTPIDVTLQRNQNRDAVVPELSMRRMIKTFRQEPVEQDDLKYDQIELVVSNMNGKDERQPG